jgi:long-chain fatty acid transport protein
MNDRGFGGTLISAAVGAALVALAGNASAGGFAIGTQNASGLGNAYAGAAATAEDASTIWYNPAGMTRLPGRQAVGSLNALKPETKFSSDTSRTTLPPLITTGLTDNGGDAGDWAFVPDGYLSWQLTPELWAGIGLSAPFGLTTEWDSGWVGRFHAIKSDLLTININPSIAWKVNEMFSVGAGISAMYIDAELTNAVDYSAIAASPGGAAGAAALGALAVPGACPGAQTGAVALGGGRNCEGVATVKGDDWSWGWNLGAMFNVSPETRIGVAYRSTVKQKLGGDVSFSNRPAILNAAVPNSGVTAEVKLPDTLSVGLAHGFGRFQILADYTWTGWDSVQDLTVVRSSGATLSNTPLRFKNSWRVGLGLNYQLDSQWKLRVGTAYDKTPVQDEFRTPRLPDESRVWLALGAQWQFSKQGALDFGYAHEFVDDASSQLVSAAPPSAPQGNLYGTYKLNVNIVGVQLRYNF